MDLGFRFDEHHELTELPADLAAVLAGVTARQAASPTAFRQARIESAPVADTLFASADGAFNGTVAAALARWGEE